MRRKALFAIVAAAALLLMAPPANAKQTHLLLEEGFGSAVEVEFINANGLAIDGASGDLLVIDSTTKTISRFNPDGTPANFSALGTHVIDGKVGADLTPQNGLFFTGSQGVQQVTVDNSGTFTDGNIYVTQGHEEAGNLMDVFASSGEYLGQLTGAGATKFGTSGPSFSPCGVAVDGSGNLFIAGANEKKIYKFDPSANPPVDSDHVATFTTNWPEPPFAAEQPVCNLAAGAGPTTGSLFANTFFTFEANSVVKLDASSGAFKYVVDPGEDRLVAVDPASGHVYAGGADSQLREYDAAGGSGASLVSSFPSSFNGIAIDGASGKVYVSLGPRVDVFGPIVTIPDVTTGAATITGDTSVTVHGTVNPDGVALDQCFFEYGPTTSYGQTAPCAETPAEIGAGTAPVTVHADLSGLDPETLYHYRLVARNPNATLYPNDPRAIVEGADEEFKTPGKPTIKATWAMDVITNDAKLKATINPENSPTTYRLEWGLTPSYGESTAEIGIGSGTLDRTVSLALSGLQPGTAYHWRVVATNGIGVTDSGDHEFTTFPLLPPVLACPNDALRPGDATSLPDCRAYEMVSPVDKENGDIRSFNNLTHEPAAINQSAVSGEKLTYSSYRAFGDVESAPFTSQYVASRDAAREEWASESISPPRNVSFLVTIDKNETQYRAFSEDLCTGWLLHDTDPPLAPGAPPGFADFYERDNCDPGAGAYKSLIPDPPPNLQSKIFVPVLQGLSADGAKAVFRVNDKMTNDANAGANFQCYGSFEGELRLISVLPSGAASKSHCSVGTANASLSSFRAESVHNAVSDNAARIYWTEAGAPQGRGPIHLRLNGFGNEKEKECAKAISPCTVTVTSNGTGQFWSAAADGSKAIYTLGNVSPVTVSSLELYEFNLDAAKPSESKSTPIAGQVAGVLGASEDASRVYFASAEDLDGGGAAQAGEPNLYLYQAAEGGAGTYDFVAILAEADARAAANDAQPTPLNVAPPEHSARVTADGNAAAFVSTAPLTGYDNVDANSGKPDTEVFHYDATANGGAGQLRCVSCNPTGGRPVGREFDLPGAHPGIWTAARLPVVENHLYSTRVLSEDGERLFFESYEALVLRDTNSARDVYQWEAPGKGNCTGSHPDFSPTAGGCVSLISSGHSAKDSEFADASPSGDDVFFKTGESLLARDPGLIDVYDARVGGGFHEPEPIPPCEGEACQSPPPPPEALSPASAIAGPGNVRPRKGRRCGKGKRRVERRGRTRCLPRRQQRKGSGRASGAKQGRGA